MSHRRGPDQTQTRTFLAGQARALGLAARLEEENILNIKVKIFQYFSITFSLHAHLEAFLKSAVLTLVPDKKVPD